MDTRRDGVARVRGRRRALRWVVLALVLAGAVLIWVIGDLRLPSADRIALALLESPDPESRRQGAWMCADQEVRAAEPILVAGALGGEPRPRVRESFVYALGRLGSPHSFGALEFVIEVDGDGYVRQAAWLAAARVDARRFRALAAARPGPEDPWDRIGIAQGWLQVGDARGVADLLYGSATGSTDQRLVASRALDRSVRPILETVGRWPLGAHESDNEPWPQGLTEEVTRRCGPLDLQRIMDDTLPHLEKSRAVQRNAQRLTNARGRLVGWLFAR